MGKKGLDQAKDILMRDIFAIIWVILIVVIILLTFFGKEYIKDMIVVTILFLAFLMLEPIVRLSHGSKITRMISGGKEVPPWKRFPLFFIAILIVFAIKYILEAGLEEMFPTESVNIILVIFWLIAMFAIYYLIFTPNVEELEDRVTKSSYSKTRYIKDYRNHKYR